MSAIIRRRPEPILWGAIPNATSDQAVPIQRAFSAAAGKTLRIPAGTYLLSADVEVPSNIRVIAEAGTVFKPTTGTSSNPVLLSVANKSDVYIEGITFDGDQENISGFNNVVTVFQSSRVVFNRCRWQNTKGIGVIFSTSIVDSGVMHSHFNEVGSYNKVTTSDSDRRQAIAFSSGTQANNKGNFADFNTFTEVGLDCVSFSTQSDGRIIGNKVRINYSGSIYVSSSMNVKVIGNDIANGATGGNAIDVYNSQKIAVTGNTCHECGGCGIGMFGVLDFAVTGNVCMNNVMQGGGTLHQGGLALDTDGVATLTSRGVFSGNRSGDDGAGTQLYGYYITAGTSFSDVVFDPSNVLVGNVTAAFGGDATGYNWSPLPTSASGLATGDLWVDSGVVTVA